MDAMTAKDFLTLSKRDYENGAVTDAIYTALKEREELIGQQMSKEEWLTELGNAIHVAFRKASEHENTSKIHTLISELPEEDWMSILEFVHKCIGEFCVG